MHELLERLREGKPEDAAAAAVADPPLIAVLLDGMTDDDSAVRTLASDAAEKAARERPELLAPHADTLIDIAATAEQKEVRWHAAQMIARVELSPERADEATRILEGYLSDRSHIVEAWAMSAIVALANDHPALRARARELVHGRLESDAPSVAARARLLLDQADSWPSGSAGAS